MVRCCPCNVEIVLVIIMKFDGVVEEHRKNSPQRHKEHQEKRAPQTTI